MGQAKWGRGKYETRCTCKRSGRGRRKGGEGGRRGGEGGNYTINKEATSNSKLVPRREATSNSKLVPTACSSPLSTWANLSWPRPRGGKFSLRPSLN